MKKLFMMLSMMWVGISAFSQANLPAGNLPFGEPGIIPDFGLNNNTAVNNNNMNSVWGNKDPNYVYSSQQPDSNAEYKRLKEGLVMQGGQLKVIRNGYLFKMHGPFPLKNGAIIYTNGIIKMQDGTTPVLDEKNYMDFDGRVRPL